MCLGIGELEGGCRARCSSCSSECKPSCQAFELRGDAIRAQGDVFEHVLRTILGMGEKDIVSRALSEFLHPLFPELIELPAVTKDKGNPGDGSESSESDDDCAGALDLKPQRLVEEESAKFKVLPEDLDADILEQLIWVGALVAPQSFSTQALTKALAILRSETPPRMLKVFGGSIVGGTIAKAAKDLAAFISRVSHLAECAEPAIQQTQKFAAQLCSIVEESRTNTEKKSPMEKLSALANAIGTVWEDTRAASLKSHLKAHMCNQS